jgi:hypothetical protein
METKGALRCSLEPATCLSPEPDEHRANITLQAKLATLSVTQRQYFLQFLFAFDVPIQGLDYLPSG